MVSLQHSLLLHTLPEHFWYGVTIIFRVHPAIIKQPRQLSNKKSLPGPVHHQQTQQQFRQPSHGPQAPRFNAFTPAQHTQTLSAFSVNPASSAYAANPYNTFGFTATSSYNTTHHGFFSATQSTIAQPTPAVKQEDGTAQQGFIYRASEQELQNMEQRAAPVQQEFGWKRRRLA